MDDFYVVLYCLELVNVLDLNNVIILSLLGWVKYCIGDFVGVEVVMF